MPKNKIKKKTNRKTNALIQILKFHMFPSCWVMFSTIITLLSLLEDLSIPKHQFHWNIIPSTAVTIGYVSHRAAYNDFMKVILKWMLCWLFGWMKEGQEGHRCGKLRVVFWAINLLNPTLVMTIICRMLPTRYWVISQLSIKLWWHLLSWPFLCAAPLTAIISTLCLPAQGQLSFSSRTYFKWRLVYLSVCLCVYLCINVWLLLVCQGCRHVNML